MNIINAESLESLTHTNTHTHKYFYRKTETIYSTSNSLINEIKMEAQYNCAYFRYEDGLCCDVVCLFLRLFYA